MDRRKRAGQVESALPALSKSFALADQQLDALWDERRTAEHLSVSPRSLQTWRLRLEGPPFVKLGRGRRSRVRYRPADVLAWLERQRRGTDSTGGAN